MISDEPKNPKGGVLLLASTERMKEDQSKCADETTIKKGRIRKRIQVGEALQ